jgi:integrase
VVLSSEEVAGLLNAALGLKHKAALNVAWGAALRAAEVVSLKVSDESRRMVIRAEQGKGRKDRYVMLSRHRRARSHGAQDSRAGERRHQTYSVPVLEVRSCFAIGQALNWNSSNRLGTCRR